MDQQSAKYKKLMAMLFYTARNTSVVAGLFSLIMCVLLLTTYIQLEVHDPLDNPVLTSMLEKVTANPDDQALREQLRAVDWLARKAYFTGQQQLAAGGTMLLVGAAVLSACLVFLFAFKKRFPDSLASNKLNNIWLKNTAARKVIALSGAGLAAAAVIIVILSHTLWRDYFPEMRASGGDSAGAADKNTSSENSQNDSIGQGAAAQLQSLPYSQTFISNWPNFRGPGGFGVAYTQKAPLRWDGAAGINIAWKVALSRSGFNSPIVWEDRLFISAADGQTQEVLCYDAGNGELLWQGQVNAIPGSPAVPPQITEDTGYAAPTMATDGSSVFALFATGDIICFDFQGQRRWARNLGMPDNHYGHSSSLLTYKNLLLIQYDQSQGSRVLALDTATGETVWETARSDVLTAWSSPILINYNNSSQLILQANPYVQGYDPDTGQELWRVECLMGEIGASPAYDNGMVFAANQFAVLAAIDLNTEQIVWQAYDDLPDASSPAAGNGHLFVATAYGVVTCYDTGRGDVLWQHEFEEGSYSSPVIVGDLVYLLNRAGTMYIFRAGSEFELLAAPELGEPSDCTPAFVNNRIYIRGRNHLFCIEETE
ncbi:MAG: PQQ-binding-like beta-propeller repeat protein [Spirochaetales bacterium]|nr:PQQ-binding-like beta-propeller repeat protein [Spirochaetales bacterium]